MPFTTRSTEEIRFMQTFDWVNHFTSNKKKLQNTIKILDILIQSLQILSVKCPRYRSFNITDENHYKYNLRWFPFSSSPS